jgi:hypothetical protein
MIRGREIRKGRSCSRQFSIIPGSNFCGCRLLQPCAYRAGEPREGGRRRATSPLAESFSPNVPISNEPFGQWYNLGANHHHWVVAPGEDVGSTAVALPGIWAATEGGDGCSWGEYVDASTAENLRVPRPF